MTKRKNKPEDDKMIPIGAKAPRSVVERTSNLSSIIAEQTGFKVSASEMYRKWITEGLEAEEKKWGVKN